MHLDNQSIFSDAQTIGALSVISTNVLDMGEMAEVAYNSKGGPRQQLSRRLGVGMKVPLLVQVVEQFTNNTELSVIMEQDDDEAFGAAEQVVEVKIDAVAKLFEGFIFPMDKFPREITKRYIRLRYVADAVPATGKITAGVVTAVDGAYQG